MGRQKKYDIPDIDLVKQYQKNPEGKNGIAALHEMWFRYENLRHKMKHELEACCYKNNIKMSSIIEEFESRAWFKFINAMNSIRPEDCAHIQNWKLYIQLWGYWRSMNRDLIHEHLNWAKHTCSVSIYDDESKESNVSNIDIEMARTSKNSVDNLYDENIQKKIFWESMDTLKNKLSAKQKLMVHCRQKGMNRASICRLLKIKHTVYEDNLNLIKRILSNTISQIAKKYQYECNYSDFLV